MTTVQPQQPVGHVESLQQRKKELRETKKAMKPMINQLKTQQRCAMEPLKTRQASLKQAKQELKALPKDERMEEKRHIQEQMRELKSEMNELKRTSKMAIQELQGSRSERKEVSMEQKKLWAALKESWATSLPPVDERSDITLVVDGNNITCDRNSHMNKSTLATAVAKFCDENGFPKQKAILTFDHGGAPRKHVDGNGLQIWHSGEGAIADDVIVRYLREVVSAGDGTEGDFLVVTADRILALRALEVGATVMKPKLFLSFCNPTTAPDTVYTAVSA